MSLGDNHDQGDMEDLRRFLHKLCRADDREGFVFRLAKECSRWSTVVDLVHDDTKTELTEIAFNPRIAEQGFSVGNLKAHYVLDEDFINRGSAFVLFSLVGTLWTHVECVGNQNEFTAVEAWLEEAKS